MRDKDWVRFLWRALLTVLRYMLIGAVLLGAVGALIAAAAAMFADGGPLTLEFVWSIARQYALIGLFGGGLVGLLYGLLGQGSYS
ncbi:MAG: hypothetical protein ACK2UK_05180 [Candidatus Promineifilaceae bacterium]|jgi:uncharacterized protein (DUF2062 family)